MSVKLAEESRAARRQKFLLWGALCEANEILERKSLTSSDFAFSIEKMV